MEKSLYRHETKHEITYADYLAIKDRLKRITKPDPNVEEKGSYFIRSLYFDNYNDKVLKEKLYGLKEREKFRIRYYNYDDSFIRLEKKSKKYGLCQKQSASIDVSQVNALLSGQYDFLKESRQPLLIELYVKMKEQCLRPRVIVDYNREPYIYDAGNVRITFDTKVKSGLYNRDFFSRELMGTNVRTGEHILMEVKYDRFLPEVISMCLQMNERQKTSFSKYATCRQYG